MQWVSADPPVRWEKPGGALRGAGSATSGMERNWGCLSCSPVRLTEPGMYWPSGSLVLRHRKRRLIPAHRETPDSQQEETQSQMKTISSHRVSLQESEGETRHALNRTCSVPFHICGCVPGSLVSIREGAETYTFNSVTPWSSVARGAPLSMESSRQEYWSGYPLPSSAVLPSLGIEPGSPGQQADALPSEPSGKPHLLILLDRIAFHTDLSGRYFPLLSHLELKRGAHWL